MKLESLTVKEAFDRGYKTVWVDGDEYRLLPPVNPRKCFELRPVSGGTLSRRLPDQKVTVEVHSKGRHVGKKPQRMDELSQLSELLQNLDDKALEDVMRDE